MTGHRIVQVDAVGHDHHGEPVARLWATADPDGAGRMRVWVIPVTTAEHEDLEARLADSNTNLVDFTVAQARLEATSGVQDLRERGI